MFLFSPHYVGIEVTAHSFLIAVIKKTGRGFSVILTKEIAKDQPLTSHIPKEALPVVAMETDEVLTRQIKVPVIKPKEIMAALNFEAESLLPYPLDEALLNYEIIEKKEEETHLTLLSAKKEHLKRLLEFYKQIGIDPDHVVSIPQALASLSKELFQSDEVRLMMHVGDKKGTLALVKGGKLLIARGCEMEKFEIQKSLCALLNAAKLSVEPSVIYMIGKKEHEKLISEISGKTILYPELPLQNATNRDSSLFGLSIALALSTKHPTFRKKPFCPPLPWHFFLRGALTLTASLLILSGALFYFERDALKSREKALLERTATLKTMVSELTSPPPENPQSIPSFLKDVEETLAKKADPFPLMPQMPKVRDLLAWLSSPAGDLQFKLLDFQMTFTKRPDFVKKSEPYEAKVELTLSTASASLVNEWLSKKNPFLNPNHEFEWRKVDEGKYKALFYLKDKTRYR